MARKKGWLTGLDVEEIYVTGDANAMRAVLSGNADIGTVGTLNVLASIEAKAKSCAIHFWQPIGDYSLVLATGKGSKLADLAGKTFAASGPGGLPDQLPRLIMRTHGIDEQSARFVQIGGHGAPAGGDRRPRRCDGGQHRHGAQGRARRQGHHHHPAVAGVSRPRLCLERGARRFIDDKRLAPAYQILTDAGIRGSRYILEQPDEAARILHERLPELELPFLVAVVRDLNGEKVWGIDGGIDSRIEQDTAAINVKLGNLPRAFAPDEVLDPRFVTAALKTLGAYAK